MRVRAAPVAKRACCDGSTILLRCAEQMARTAWPARNPGGTLSRRQRRRTQGAALHFVMFFRAT